MQAASWPLTVGDQFPWSNGCTGGDAQFVPAMPNSGRSTLVSANGGTLSVSVTSCASACEPHE
jgi:hypothetical protein